MSNNQAAWLDGVGQQLRVGPADMPKVGPGQVLIRNHAVAINPVDYKMQDRGIFVSSYPTNLGFDLAGEVLEVGEGVEHIKRGDRVAAWSLGYAFQLYSAVEAQETGVLPDNISYCEGVVIPVGFMTALTGLCSEPGKGLGLPLPSFDPKPTGKVVVIWGGSGSVGSMAVQLAVAGGTKVIAISSERNFTFCKNAGASEVFDYNSASVVEDVVNAVKHSGLEFAGVYDAISMASSLEAADNIIHELGGGSCIVVVSSMPDTKIAGVQRIPISGRGGPVVEPAWKTYLTSALREGKLKPLPPPYVIGKGLEACQKGIDYVKKGVSAQKVVVDLS